MIRRVYVEDIILCYFGSHIICGFKLIGGVSKAIPDRRMQIKEKKKKARMELAIKHNIHDIKLYQTILVPVSFNASLRKEFETTLLTSF